jgi:hypothetical protein
MAGMLTGICEGKYWHNNACMRYFVAFLCFGVLVYLVVFALVCMHDLHARFWLGMLPAHAQWAAVLAFGPLLLLLGYGAYLTLYRDLQRKARVASSVGGRYSERQFDLTVTARQLWMVCAWIVIASIISVVTGAGLLYVGSIISDALQNQCGAEGISLQLDHTLTSLENFRNRCHESPEHSGGPVNFCPGFQEAFPPPSPFVTYLKVLEENLHCAGFCTKIDSPLFALGEAESKSQEACAGRLARLLWTVTLLSGVPAVVVGVLSGLTALLLGSHDEL